MRIVRRKQKAQIAVVMALASATLIGVIALCTDVGLLYYNWGLLQKAADAAVLAGSNYLPSDTAGAIATANSFASQNGIAAGEISSTTVAADQMSVSIRLTRVVPYYFAQLVGLSAGVVTTRATAALTGVSAVSEMLPIGIDSRTTYSYGQLVSLMTGQYGPGDWGPLSLNGTGASNFTNNIQYGAGGSFSIGQLVGTEPGQMVGPTRAAFDTRLTAGANSFSSGTFAKHSLSDPRILPCQWWITQVSTAVRRCPYSASLNCGWWGLIAIRLSVPTSSSRLQAALPALVLRTTERGRFCSSIK